MTRRRTRDEIESRLEDVRRRLRERHAGVEPDAQFANRVVARLARDGAWSIDWAARRVLPVSIAFALALLIAAVATRRSTGRTTEAASLSTAAQTAGDLLEWVLEGREERP